jgi:DNA-binding IclR family transcriptional regulator
MTGVARSVVRIAALFELFEREQRPLSSQEIATNLGIPRSSLGSLLKALCELGWLSIDRRRASYLPGAQLAKVTAWLQGAAVLDDRLRDAAEHLRLVTGETASVMCLADLELEVVHVSSEDLGIQLVVQPGTRIPLWGTSAGTACLATLADTTIRSMHGRALRKAGPSARLPALSSVLSLVRQAREEGVFFADSAAAPGVAAIATAAPEHLCILPTVISIGGPSERISAKQGALRQALHDCIGSLRALPARTPR